MRSSKALIRVGKMILFLAIVLLIVSFLNKALYPINSRSYQTISNYEKVETPDILFLGPSTSYRGYVPLYFKELTGRSAYNLSTGAQSLLVGEMLLKESINARKIPKVLILSITTRSLSFSNNNKDHYAAFNSIGFSWNKLVSTIRGYDLENYPDALLACYRAREYFTLENFTTEKAPYKVTGTEWEKLPDEYRNYMGAGFWDFVKTSVKAGHARTDTYSPFKADSLNKKQTDSFARIVKLCHENNIELILLIDPKPPSATIQSDYGVFVDCVRELADEHNLELWTLSYLKRDIFDADSTSFQDSMHLTGPSAFRLTEVLSRMYNEHVEGNLNLSDYLYDDYEQYLQAYPGIQAILANTNNAPKIVISIVAAHLEDMEVEYRLSAAPKDSEEFEVIQDWKAWESGENVQLNKLLKKGKYTIRLEARQKSGEIEQTSEYKNVSW